MRLSVAAKVALGCLACVPIAHLITYKSALINGRNSIAMMLLGRTGTMWLMAQLQRLAARNRERAAAALREEALEKIKVARENASTPGSVVFVGSSTFTYWTFLARDVAPVQVTNLGFGGSTTPDVLEHVEAYTSFKPKMIAYYCGTNDIARGASPQEAVQGFVDFCKQMRERLPNVGILYLSISLTPFQQYLGNTELVNEGNRLVREFVKTQRHMEFVDISADKDFTSNWGLYLNDGLHLNLEGHIRLGEIMRPAIQRLEATLNSTSQ